MADVSHELGSLRFVVDSPLSSKVAMFNQQVNQHKTAQLLNPFSGADGRSSPKPTFSKDQYGKPLAGSLTEQRGQKANIHVMKEMLELCQIIDSEGYVVKDEPSMRVIPFGELFNIYNYISDKCVGLLLRARKHKIVEFEGEMLFQRRDDNVPIFLLRPVQEIRRELEAKIEDIKRATSPAPQATSVLLDKASHQAKLQDAGLTVPSSGSGSKRNSKSRSPSPSPASATSKASSKAPSPAPEEPKTVAPEVVVVPEIVTPEQVEVKLNEALPGVAAPSEQPTEVTPTPAEPEQQQQEAQPVIIPEATNKTDINNNDPTVVSQDSKAMVPTTSSLPTIVIEASAVYVSGSGVVTEENTATAESATAESVTSVSTESTVAV